MDNKTCNECFEVFDLEESVRRHVRKHGITFQEYSLKWMHGGVIPKCKCGCNKDTNWNIALMNYTTFVHGHHAFGRKKSDDEKRKIGEKNSVNMKRYLKEHVEIGVLRNKQMRAKNTPEKEEKRIAASRKAIESMSDDDRQHLRDNMQRRWASGTMLETKKKSEQTFRQRSKAGVYDYTERNKKLSEVISQKYIDGDWKFAKGFYESIKTKRNCYYRSSWELQFMKKLDEDETVIDWESEFIAISYEFAGAIHKYVPDFLVIKHTHRELVEIKPMALRTIERNIAKRLAAQKYCVENNINYVEWEPTNLS